MEQIKFELNDLLRYGCGGGVFLGGGTLLSLSPCKIANLDLSGAGLSLLAAVALLIGILIYALHRALFYPIMLRLVHRGVLPKDQREKWWACPYRVTKFEAEQDIARWQRKATNPQLQAGLDYMGSQTHFLYVVALALILAVATSYVMGTGTGTVSRCVMTGFSVLVLVAAFAHNMRCCELGIALSEKLKEETKPVPSRKNRRQRPS